MLLRWLRSRVQTVTLAIFTRGITSRWITPVQDADDVFYITRQRLRSIFVRCVDVTVRDTVAGRFHIPQNRSLTNLLIYDFGILIHSVRVRFMVKD